MAISRIKEHELIMISIYDALIYISMGKEFSVEEILEGVYEMEYYDFMVECGIATAEELNLARNLVSGRILKLIW